MASRSSSKQSLRVWCVIYIYIYEPGYLIIVPICCPCGAPQYIYTRISRPTLTLHSTIRLLPLCCECMHACMSARAGSHLSCCHCEDSGSGFRDYGWRTRIFRQRYRLRVFDPDSYSIRGRDNCQSHPFLVTIYYTVIVQHTRELFKRFRPLYRRTLCITIMQPFNF